MHGKQLAGPISRLFVVASAVFRVGLRQNDARVYLAPNKRQSIDRVICLFGEILFQKATDRTGRNGAAHKTSRDAVRLVSPQEK